MSYSPVCKSKKNKSNSVWVSIVLNDIRETETVSFKTACKKFAEFNRQAYTTNVSPIAETIKGTELDYHNTIEIKSKTFEETSREEKIKFVNKQIDDLLDFIERNKQAKYNTWKKEFYNGSSKL